MLMNFPGEGPAQIITELVADKADSENTRQSFLVFAKCWFYCSQIHDLDVWIYPHGYSYSYTHWLKMLLIGVVNGGKFDHLQASDDCQCLAFPTMLCGNIFHNLPTIQQVGQSLWRAVKKFYHSECFW